jgi:hypothetical protein
MTTPATDQAHLQLRAVPAQDRRGHGQAQATVATAQRRRPALLLLHLRRRRLHPRAHLRDRRLAARQGIETAPHLACIGSDKGRDPRHRPPLHRAGHHPHRRAARRPALRHGPRRPRHLPLRQRAGELPARGVRRPLPHRGRRLPRVPPPGSVAEADLANFKRKVEAGADAAITQYFYNADAYFRSSTTAPSAGIDLPIVPGIMPITNYTQLARFSDACGAEIPRWVRKRLEGFGDDKTPSAPSATMSCSTVPTPARRRRPRAALLHHEPVRTDAAALAGADVPAAAEDGQGLFDIVL